MHIIPAYGNFDNCYNGLILKRVDSMPTTYPSGFKAKICFCLGVHFVNFWIIGTRMPAAQKINRQVSLSKPVDFCFVLIKKMHTCIRYGAKSLRLSAFYNVQEEEGAFWTVQKKMSKMPLPIQSFPAVLHGAEWAVLSVTAGQTGRCLGSR